MFPIFRQFKLENVLILDMSKSLLGNGNDVYIWPKFDLYFQCICIFSYNKCEKIEKF